MSNHSKSCLDNSCEDLAYRTTCSDQLTACGENDLIRCRAVFRSCRNCAPEGIVGAAIDEAGSGGLLSQIGKRMRGPLGLGSHALASRSKLKLLEVVWAGFVRPSYHGAHHRIARWRNSQDLMALPVIAVHVAGAKVEGRCRQSSVGAKDVQQEAQWYRALTGSPQCKNVRASVSWSMRSRR